MEGLWCLHKLGQDKKMDFNWLWIRFNRDSSSIWTQCIPPFLFSLFGFQSKTIFFCTYLVKTQRKKAFEVFWTLKAFFSLSNNL